MPYKNVQHYRHTVHRYLDAIWSASSHKKKARSTMYKLLSNKMNLDINNTHVAKFNREQCKQAIKILRPMYVQLFGHDLNYKKKGKSQIMYYSNKTLTTNVKVQFTNKTSVIEKCFHLTITVYCRSKVLNETGCIIDLPNMEKALKQMLDNKCLNDILGCQPTLERLAKYIYEQVIPCYKVAIKNDKFEEAIYEETVE